MSTTTTLLGPAEIRELAERAGVRPTKTLGPELRARRRHGAQDRAAGRRRARATASSRSAPASGSLTLGLLEAGADVVAVEIDPVLARLLPSTVARHVPGPDDRRGRRRRAGGAARRGRPRPPDDRAGRRPRRARRCPARRRPRSSPTCRTTSRSRCCSRSSSGSTRLRARARHGAGRGGRPAGRAARAAARTASRRPRRPGTRRPGAPRPSGRSVFWPAPNVDSALVRLDRREPPATDASREARLRGRRRRVRAAAQDAPLGARVARGVAPTRPSRRSAAAGRGPAGPRRARWTSTASRASPEHLGHLGPVDGPTWHGGAVTLTPVAPLPEHEVRVRAPGKVNLSLRVGPREDDGYHPLSTVFQAVSVFEEVVATPVASSVTLTVSGPQAELVPTDGTNLALRAARAAGRARRASTTACTCTCTRACRSRAAWPAARPTPRPTLVACDALWRTGLQPRRPARARRRAGVGRAVLAGRPHRGRLRAAATC